MEFELRHGQGDAVVVGKRTRRARRGVQRRSLGRHRARTQAVALEGQPRAARMVRKKQTDCAAQNQGGVLPVRGACKTVFRSCTARCTSTSATGLRSLSRSKKMGRKGCLIADEMGLGKTLQALAVCKYLMEETETPLRVCVISPGYLRANWATEINKWGILRPDVDRAETMIKLTDRPFRRSEPRRPNL